MGVRIFPEARDEKGSPLNQTRRQKRLVRRQLRRRRMRRRLLNETLSDSGLLPPFSATAEWREVMALDPYELRRRGLDEALSPHEFGRATYHLAQHRHFRGRDLEEAENAEDGAEEKAEREGRDTTLAALKAARTTLGAYLAELDPHVQRRRGIHALRSVVAEEFDRLWTAQAKHHPALLTDQLKAAIHTAIFAQRPVFWRKNTLGQCRFLPGEALCPKGAWLSQQRRMLEKLNNVELASGNFRPLDKEERAAILDRLQTQASMTWGAVRTALKPVYAARREKGRERTLRFNLELGGEKGLLGNAVEARLAHAFGKGWATHPHRDAIREAVPQRLWQADYGEIGDQRVVIRSDAERQRRRVEAAHTFIADFGITADEAQALRDLSFASGWEPYSTTALKAFLPHLEQGVRFGELTNGPRYAVWRVETFPDRDQPTGEVLDKLPSPSDRDEQRRIASLRNPTVARTQNELRKVVNNLIAAYGKPDQIRIELAREVGKSKRERDEMGDRIRSNERDRKKAAADLESKGITQPTRRDMEKWLLWQESQHRCPYTGDEIGFDALFRQNEYEIEHIWPRSRSFDDSFANKTLCRRDINLAKGNRTPFEYLGHDEERWSALQNRLQGMLASKGGAGLSRGKIRRFLAQSLPDDFATRQLNDTGYAARNAIAFLKRLWPDVGPEAPVHVQAVSGRVTAQLRKLWSLNNILADDGEKTRADHRHHAVDALTVACAHPGMTQRLSRYWQQKEDPGAPRPNLPPPWESIRVDAGKAVADIVVSHRVRKKVSGPLHKETTYGDTGQDTKTKTGIYRQFVTRKKVEVLTKTELAAEPETSGEGIRDDLVRRILQDWVTARGGEPKKAFPPYPRLGPDGPEIRKVRLISKQQQALMAPVSTGYADLGSNHHIAIYRQPDGGIVYDVVSLFEAARRLRGGGSVVRRRLENGETFVMSLAPGDAIQIPDGPKRGIWIVQGVWANGPIVLLRMTDAVGITVVRPNASSLVKDHAQKISIDPIGRIRPARD